MTPLTQTPQWQALAAHREMIGTRHLNDFFAADPQRFDRLSLRCGDLLADFSKQRVNADTLALLVALAEARDLSGFLRRMRAGEAINTTENRAALHIALRAERPCHVDGKDVLPDVRATRARMRAVSDAIRAGVWRGSGGHAINAIVNLGVGGSDLGPRMAAQALGAHANVNAGAKLKTRFVANLDPAEFADTVRDLDPARTLFIVSSKTFTTQETLANARAAKTWLGAAADPARHFLAVSNNIPAAQAFGIPAQNCFALPEWVGGRFSLWSAIGLPLACAIGMDAFEAMLAGAREMDDHFFSAPLSENLPVTMALIGLWNTDFLGAGSLAILPYAHRLALLPAYLQQLEMESNGKRVTLDGRNVGCATAPIVWGAAGSIGQHAFHQLLYQGTRTVPIDFIVPLGDAGPEQSALVANALAQSAALMRGQSPEAARRQLLAAGKPQAEADRLTPHLACPGNQPSTTLLLPRLTPRALGSLIALYEHKVAAQGCLWDINSFDQWGVEYGKQMGREIQPRLNGKQDDDNNIDASSAGLLAAIRAMRKS
ncbi:MAG: glucose-6-phosphate isomerase [Zoogloeaceae bacterium]|jgi:glucose-6-phosphate isomerase|nr:glucose-6-phosphate isomerase [Zoogloeaceae bacterium]